MVLVSDGHPTDVDPELAARIGCRAATVEDFLTWEPLAAFHASGRVSRCVRLAVGIGGDADQEMLRAFVNTPGLPVLRVQDARGIERFFQMVTMSVAQRSVSRNPDVFSVPNFEPFLDQDLVI